MYTNNLLCHIIQPMSQLMQCLSLFQLVMVHINNNNGYT